jgi:hypothetical protein
MHRMLSASGVIDGALLRMRMADGVCIEDQRQLSMSGAVQTMLSRIGGRANLDMIRVSWRWQIVFEME